MGPAICGTAILGPCSDTGAAGGRHSAATCGNLGAPIAQTCACTWLLLPPQFFSVGVLVHQRRRDRLSDYVQTALAARFSSPLVWMVLPAVIFALGHYLLDQAGENALVTRCGPGFFLYAMAI